MKKFINIPNQILCFLIVFFSVSCGASGNKNEQHQADGQQKSSTHEVTVFGKVLNPGTGQVTIQEVATKVAGQAQTIEIGDDNTFKKTLTLTNPGFYQLNFFGVQTVTVILDKHDVEINVDGSNPRGLVEIKGSPDADLINATQAKMNINDSPEMKALEEQFNVAVAAKDQNKIVMLQNQAQKLMNDNLQQVANHLSGQPASLGLVYLLQQGNIFMDKDPYIDLYVSVADKVMKAYPTSSHAMDFNNMVTNLKKIAVGQLAPEIALPNPQGNVVKLSSFRGKYVLIDFWAKWCGPCRQENPNVVRAYKQYKDKGFEVFGVSLDRNLQDWQQAIAEDGITYTQVSDLKYFDSVAAREYNIEAIPYSILVDKQGVIIAKNLRGEALHDKLAEVLGN